MNRRKRELDERRKRHEAREAERLNDWLIFAADFQRLADRVTATAREWVARFVLDTHPLVVKLQEQLDWIYFAETGGGMDAKL